MFGDFPIKMIWTPIIGVNTFESNTYPDANYHGKLTINNILVIEILKKIPNM